VEILATADDVCMKSGEDGFGEGKAIMHRNSRMT
jgi:hypothetical protein